MKTILNLVIFFVEKNKPGGDTHSIVYKGEKMGIDFAKEGYAVEI
jgi:hypothetical protein